MAGQISHGWARTKERLPAGVRQALCGVLAPRRFVRTSGFACPMCQAVRNNTVSSAATLGARRGEGRQGGGRR